MIAYWIHNFDPFALQFGGGFGVRWYGLAYLAAFAVAYFIYLHLAKRGLSVIPPEKVGDFITGCAVFGVLIGGAVIVITLLTQGGAGLVGLLLAVGIPGVSTVNGFLANYDFTVAESDRKSVV